MAYVCGHYSFAGPFSRDVDLGPLQTAVNSMVQQIDSQPADDLQVFRCSHFSVVFCGLKSGHCGKMPHCVRKANYAEVARKSSLLFTLLRCIDQAPWQIVLIFVLLCLQGCYDNLSWSLFFSVCSYVMTTCPDLCYVCAGMSWQLAQIFVMYVQGCHDNLPRSLLHNYVQGCHDNLPRSLLHNYVQGCHDNLPRSLLHNYVQGCHDNLSRSLLHNYVQGCHDNLSRSLLHNYVQGCHHNLPRSLLHNYVQDVMTTCPDLCYIIMCRDIMTTCPDLCYIIMCRDVMTTCTDLCYIIMCRDVMTTCPDLCYIIMCRDVMTTCPDLCYIIMCRDVMTTCTDLCYIIMCRDVMTTCTDLCYIIMCRDVMTTCTDLCYIIICRDVMTTCTDLCYVCAGMSSQLALIFVSSACRNVMTTCPDLCFLCLQECHDNLSWSVFFCVCRKVMTTWLDLGSSVHARMSWQLASIFLLCVCAGMACQPIIFLFFVCRHVMTSWPGLSSSVRTTWYDFLFSLSAGLSREPDVKFVLLCAVCRDAMATCVLHFSSLYVQGCHDKLPQSLFFCVCSVMTTFHNCSSMCAVSWQLSINVVLLCAVSWQLFHNCCSSVHGCQHNPTWSLFLLCAGMSWQIFTPSCRS